MKATRHTGGIREIDDSAVVDLPYKCRHCGKWIKIENRHSWLHDCIDEDLVGKIREEEPVAEVIKDETNPPITEITPNDIHSTILHIGGKTVHLKQKEHNKGSDWFSWTYFFNKKDAVLVFEASKKKNENVIDGDVHNENDSYLDKIQLSKSSKNPFVRFIYMWKSNEEEPPQKTPKKPPKKLDKSTLIVLIAIILGISFLYYYNQYITDKDTRLTEEEIEQQIFEETPIEISFTEYLTNYKDYDNEKVTLIGVLSRGIRKLGSGGGVYVEYVVDDFNNGITLLNLKKEQINLFPKTGYTDELYSVTGKFKRRYKGLDLEVTEIIKTERQEVLVKKEIDIDETTPLILEEENKTMELNFTKIFDFVKQIINVDCKEGERRYKTQCIPIITCSDDTLHPECSTNKPKQCVNGSLVNKASVCDCPIDYKREGDSCIKIRRCEDKTIYGECSKNKPLYCGNGKLIEKASTCGCDYKFKAVGDKCMEKTKAQALNSFNYINELRESYGKNKLEWDERAYNLAVDRSKDLYDRNYFDHVTPEGTCAKDMKSDYGFESYEILAENLGGMTYYPDTGTPIFGTSPKEAVNSWMDSRGHRYNLMYNHKTASIGCYRHICAFLGVHTDPYGLGAGPCTTGDEGSAFWESIGKQPGEN